MTNTDDFQVGTPVRWTTNPSPKDQRFVRNVLIPEYGGGRGGYMLVRSFRDVPVGRFVTLRRPSGHIVRDKWPKTRRDPKPKGWKGKLVEFNTEWLELAPQQGT